MHDESIAHFDPALRDADIASIPRYVRFNPRGRVAQQAAEASCAEATETVDSGGSGVVERLRAVLEAEVRRALFPARSGVGSDVDAVADDDDTNRQNFPAASSQQLVTPVSWLRWSFAIPRVTPVAKLQLYNEGELVAMDAASMLSVVLLGPQTGERVLDMCCAPGMKLGLIADLVAPDGVAVGVDVSPDRMYVARKNLIKYSAPSCRLYLGDARMLKLPLPVAHDSDPYPARERHLRAVVKRVKKKKHQQQQQRNAGDLYATDVALHTPTLAWMSPALPPPQSFSSSSRSGMPPAHSPESMGLMRCFDRVLVDAECTHDGSIDHMVGKNKRDAAKLNTGFGMGASGSNGEHPPHLTGSLPPAKAARMEGCHEAGELSLSTTTGHGLLLLQQDLLQRAFELTRPGGFIVYSTCALAEDQNEGVVQKFLGRNTGAVELVDPLVDACTRASAVDACAACRIALTPSEREELRNIATAGRMVNTLRITPSSARTSFQFIAKFKKL